MAFFSLLVIVFVLLFLLKKYNAGGVNQYYGNLYGKTVLITGCNTGIGIETAKILCGLGAKIIMACRNVETANKARLEVIRHSPHNPDLSSTQVQVVQLDLSSFKSIEACVKELVKMEIKINVLINNAGVAWVPYTKTEDGLEMQVGTNHIGHFYFTILLFDNRRMVEDHARVVNVSSRAHKRGGAYDVENILMNESNYKMTKAYADSKLSNILFTIELQRRMNIKGRDEDTCSLHPGVVVTELARSITSGKLVSILSKILYPLIWLLLKSPRQGAQTTISCTLNPSLSKGAYYSDCEVTQPVLPPNYEEVAQKLWKKSEEVCNYKSKYFN